MALLILGEAAGRTSGMTLPSASGRSGGYRGRTVCRAIFDLLGIKPDWEKIKYYILLDELF